MIGEGLGALAIALMVIFCTPFGWVGLICFGVAISMIKKSKKR